MGKVHDLLFASKPVNPARLHQEIAAVVGSKFRGVSLGPSGVRAHVEMDAGELETTYRDLITPVLAAHNPALLTVEQQKEADRVAIMESLRGKAWAQWTPGDRDAILKILAERVLGRYLDDPL